MNHDTLRPLQSAFVDPMAPLHTCAPLTILHACLRQTGDTCSPQTTEEGELPPGWLSLCIDGLTYYYTSETLHDLGQMLTTQFRRHCCQPPADTDPTA
jgi:hypothetical protein